MLKVALNGKIGDTYNIGGYNQLKNIDVVNKICDILDRLHPCKIKGIKKNGELINFVKDRPGHDQKYAIDASKIKKKLKWKPQETFETGLTKTVRWYLENQSLFKNKKNLRIKNRYGVIKKWKV